MQTGLSAVDIGILFAYCCALIWMGLYYRRKCRTADQFMVADRSIPAWAAGLAVMSAYTSSISYIATPGKAFDSNWHPFIFSLCILPVAWVVCRYAVPYYQKIQLISVYSFLEDRLGPWGRVYAALSFLLYMIGRVAVILYLVGLLMSMFVPWNICIVILVIGGVTIIYTLLGGMEAVIWTDVVQSVIMIAGILFCAVTLSLHVFSGPQPLIQAAIDNNKFSLGSLKFTLSSQKHLFDRTIWVMIIYGVTENLRSLLADQNYVQKYCSVRSEREAKRSIWIAMLIYIPLTAVFLYIGTTLFAFYSGGNELVNVPGMTNEQGNVVGDRVFPHFIATEVPAGLKGLIIAAIVAAAMSTIDSALNSSATVLLLDFYKRKGPPAGNNEYRMSNTEIRNSKFEIRNSKFPNDLLFLRLATLIVGLFGTGAALLMIRAGSILDVWWQISGIFGGALLGLFVLAFLRVRLRLWQGLVSIAASIAVITWGTFARNLPKLEIGNWKLEIPVWAQCNLDGIIVGAVGTAAFLAVACGWSLVARLSGHGPRVTDHGCRHQHL